MTSPGLSCRDLTVGVPGRTLVECLALDLEAGSFLGILGRNGSGKTTTLHTLCGLRPCDGAGVVLDGRPIGDWPRKEFATRVGLVTQHLEDSFPCSVLEFTLAGRHPHLDFWQWEGERDRQLAREALSRVGLDGLEHRPVGTLSGGERRRLEIAMLLCQSTQTCLLDEPTNHLDPAQEKVVLTLLRRLADEGHAVAASLHDVNAAYRYCDRCLLLFGDGGWALGRTHEVVTDDSLYRLYGVKMRRIEDVDRNLFIAL